MGSLSIALPVVQDGTDGFRMIKNLRSLVKQNLKMLVLTNPGERVMEPDFGVGIKQFLFQNFSDDTFSQIDNKIREQAKLYMPIININDVSFFSEEQDSNILRMKLSYSIPDIAANELLDLLL